MKRLLLLLTLLMATACNQAAMPTGVLELPPLTPLDHTPRAVATTSLIGEVVGRVGGEHIDLTTLMGPGIDPHAYEPTAVALAAAAEADAIFVNGWQLEESLLETLAGVTSAPQIPVSAGITPRVSDDNDAADPHVWLDPRLVALWAANVATALGALDPGNAAAYDANAAAYRAEMDALYAELADRLASLSPERRRLVTNHDALGYFAAAFDFTVAGTVIPGSSTLAEPGPADLARLAGTLRDAGICAIFIEESAPAGLATAVAGEVEGCDSVTIAPLYVGALGPPGSPAATYAGLMRTNATTILEALR